VRILAGTFVYETLAVVAYNLEALRMRDMNYRFTGLLLAFFTLLFASLGGVSGAAITGQITGTVTDQSTHQPISGATVTAVSGSSTVQAVTDAKGAFALLGVVPDTYTVSVERPGYQAFSLAGVTVLPDNTQNLTLVVSSQKQLRTIASVSVRNPSGAFQRGQTEDSYTVSGTALKTLQGKEFNNDQKTLLSRIPSVTLDRTGTISIRGGNNFQTGYQFEGIDYTSPNANLENPYQNVGNFNLLTGFGQVQVIPGGGDASHGNTGTGLVSITAKRGTNPPFGTVDYETQTNPVRNHQYAFEYGIATRNNSLSNYLSVQNNRQYFQYGNVGSYGPGIGIFYPGANYPGTGVNVYNTAFDQQSNDFIDNLFLKFGKNQAQQLQVFVQSQAVRQGQGYNGYSSSSYLSGTDPNTALYDAYYQGSNGIPSVLGYPNQLVPLFPGQVLPVQKLSAEDAIYNAFTAYKVEYSDNFKNSYATLRFYQTINDQELQQPGIGTYATQSGGKRTGVAAELNSQIGTRHFVQIGGKFEYVRPFGTLEQFADLPSSTTVGNFFGLGSGLPLPAAGAAETLVPFVDFQPSASCPGRAAANGSPGIPPGSIVNPNFGLPGIPESLPCGYIANRPSFAGARLPYEEDNPLTDQQVYGIFAQDTFSVGSRLRVQSGLRLDGYNFLFPDDPQNPPTIATVRHQRLYEPHLGITQQLGQNDQVRATFGRTLSVPLPGLAGNYINRAPYAPFVGIPSYDNSKGVFNAANPKATAATYCGVSANVACKDYADQLYWLTRDGKYGTAQLGSAVRGATYTNYDFTYQHQFPKGVALSLTPFYRRGYDVVERSTSLVSQDYETGLQVLGPLLESNLGVQKSTGVELLLSRASEFGLSGQLTATYLNQFGNDPPGTYLTNNSLISGNLYRSPYFSPFESTVALQYRSRSGLRINPIFSYNIGYPYGVGTLTQVLINGKLYTVPYTDIIAQAQPPYTTGVGGTPALYVDPQNPGSFQFPVIAATNGFKERSAAGGLLSKPSLNVDLTIEFTTRKRLTYGASFTNLLDQLYSVPVPNPRFNRACNYGIIATGIPGPGVGTTPSQNANCPAFTGIAALKAGSPLNYYDDPYGGKAAYLVLPNRPPLAGRVYVQVPI